MTDASPAMSRTERSHESGIVDLLDVRHERRVVGGKASPLAIAAEAGLRVPAGFVVTASARVTASELAERIAKLGAGPFAVRSSAVAEDSASRSFAGQLETLLNVAPPDVMGAIERCRASGSALRVLCYAGTAGDVAVIVQQQVAAEVAGVAFSADPRTGERGVVVIDATRGLGDRLVSGEVDAESWRCANEPVRLRATSESVLDAATAARVADLARRCEQLFGRPQDIEWAIAGGQLYLLQSRPITALPAAPIEIPIEVPPGTWQRDDHHAVLSPLGVDWFAPYPKAMARMMGKIMPIEDMRTAMIGGHLYMQMVMAGGGGGGAAPPGWILWLVSRLVPSMRRADKVCTELLDREMYMATLDDWEQRGRRELAAATDALFVRDPSVLDDEALLQRIEAALAHSAVGLGLHAELGGPAMFAAGKLALFIEDELGWSPNEALTLVAGSSDKTTELHREIERIVVEHASELGDAAFPHTFAELTIRAPKMAEAIATWLDVNRLRMMHYEPKNSMLGERPEVVLAIAASIAASRSQPKAESADARLEEARAKLSPERYRELERLLVNARRGYALRDENGIETVSRPAGLLRHYVLELGRRLGLEDPSHAVYLRVAEHRAALRGENAHLAATIERRRGEESWALQRRGPMYYGKPPGAMPPADPFPSGLRRAFRIFGWMMKLEVMPEVAAEGQALKGVGIGTRIVTGKARVIDRPEQLGSLHHGEVLVCRITSPEWSVALGRVGAIVTNEGALLSHPAIIAREYGIPAVVGTGVATDRIRTGDTVRVDPVEGTVAIVPQR